MGLFSVFQFGMLGMKTVLVDALKQAGGQCRALYPQKPIYDIPGYPVIGGGALIERLEAQAAPFEPTYVLGHGVEGLEELKDGGVVLQVRSESSGVSCVEGAAVVLAAGHGLMEPRRPPIKGLPAFEGRSVLYEVTDIEDLRQRTVAIAGGGDSALDWTVTLASKGAQVHLVHRRENFRAMPSTLQEMERLRAEGRVIVHAPAQIRGVAGEGDQIRTLHLETSAGPEELPIERLLLFYGMSSKLTQLSGWGLEQDQRGNFVVNPATQQTNRTGIYAIGDVCTYPGKLKLILQGFSEAAVAAQAIYTLMHEGQVAHFEYSTSKGLPRSSGQRT